MTDTIKRDKEQRDESKIVRRLQIERLRESSGDEETTVYRVSLSSEREIQDWPWAAPNLLKHSKSAIDLSHLGDRGLPFLRDHGAYNVENMLGRIINLRVEDKRLVGELRWSKSNPNVEVVRGMIDEGTLTDMSISAEPIERKIIRDDAEGRTLRVEWTKWRPLEASAVVVGADHTVGIGRKRAQDYQQDNDRATVAPKATDGASSELTRGKEMDPEELENDGENSSPDDSSKKRVDRARTEHDSNIAKRNEERRIASCRKFGESNGIDSETVDVWITRGYSLDQVADDIQSIMQQRAESAPTTRSALDLTRQETQRYSLTRAILAAHSENWKGAEFEAECSQEIAERLNKPADKHVFYVPYEVQRRHINGNFDSNEVARSVVARHGVHPSRVQRDLNVADGASGGFTVGTTILGFDPLLRNISVLMAMGATRLPGLRDNISIPRQTASATADWLGSETDAITETQQGFTQLALTPHDVGAYTELSRRLLMQSSIGVEAFVTTDLAATVALAVDLAGIQGSGADGQPTGLNSVSGIGAVTGASLGFPGVLNFQEDVATSNVMPLSGGYVTTPAVASLMIQRVKYTGTASPLWEGNLWNGNMQGFPAMSSNQIAAANMYFGDWAKMVLAEWGTLEIDTNPYAGFQQGIIGVRAIYSIDFGVRYPGAFSRATSIT